MATPIDIVLRSEAYVVEDTPFKNDLFGRKALADKLTAYIGRVHSGCVIAIDAPWGDGKSWFGQNWACDLKKQGCATVYLDAFASDYSADPFWLITSAVSKEIKGHERKEFRDAAAKIARSAVPFAAKVVVSAISNHVFGDTEIADILSDAAVGDKVEKYMERELAKHEEHAKSVVAFKYSIQTYVTELKKPMVIFVDELDRCAPEFAVRLLERVKHFFDIDGVTFVLLINRTQLENAIKGVYGADIDAAAYLSKFINVTFSLPKKTATQDDGTDYNIRYCEEILKRHQFKETDDVQTFVHMLCAMAPCYNLSFRDLERAFTLFAIAAPMPANNSPYVSFLTYLIILKLKLPDIFAGLMRRDATSSQDAMATLAHFNGGDDTYAKNVVSAIRTIHNGHRSGNFESGDPQVLHIMQMLPVRNYYQVFPNLAKRIDVALD